MTHKEDKKDNIPRYRVVFVGDQGVGKTSIIQRFHNSSFNLSQIVIINNN